MDKAIETLINKADSWVVDFVLFSIGAIIIVWVFTTIKSVSKNISAEDKINKLIRLQDEYNNLDNRSNSLYSQYKQTRSVLTGLKITYSELKSLVFSYSSGYNIREESGKILRSITDRLSTEIKYFAGEIHRCAIWIPIDDKYLGMIEASAGFPDNYKMQKKLPIDKSSAGRCYRTKMSCFIPDVEDNNDFNKSHQSNHGYKSLICVPVVFGEDCLGVITIDGKEDGSLNKDDIEAVETYAEIVSMTLMLIILDSQRGVLDSESEREVAIGKEE